LKQLAGREIPDDIRKAFLGRTRPLLLSLMRILRTTIASLPQVFICVDALDELPESNLPELLESLREFSRSSRRREYSSPGGLMSRKPSKEISSERLRYPSVLTRMTLENMCR